MGFTELPEKGCFLWTAPFLQASVNVLCCPKGLAETDWSIAEILLREVNKRATRVVCTESISVALRKSCSAISPLPIIEFPIFTAKGPVSLFSAFTARPGDNMQPPIGLVLLLSMIENFLACGIHVIFFAPTSWQSAFALAGAFQVSKSTLTTGEIIEDWAAQFSEWESFQTFQAPWEEDFFTLVSFRDFRGIKIQRNDSSRWLGTPRAQSLSNSSGSDRFISASTSESSIVGFPLEVESARNDSSRWLGTPRAQSLSNSSGSDRFISASTSESSIVGFPLEVESAISKHTPSSRQSMPSVVMSQTSFDSESSRSHSGKRDKLYARRRFPVQLNLDLPPLRAAPSSSPLAPRRNAHPTNWDRAAESAAKFRTVSYPAIPSESLPPLAMCSAVSSPVRSGS